MSCDISTMEGKLISRGTQNLVISGMPKISENNQAS